MKSFAEIKKKLQERKGQLGGSFDNMAAVFVGLATVMVISVVIFLVISQARTQIFTVEGLNGGNSGVLNDTVCQQSVACNATKLMKGSVSDAVSFIPLVVIALIGVVLLGLVAIFRRNR